MAMMTLYARQQKKDKFNLTNIYCVPGTVEEDEGTKQNRCCLIP